MDLRSVGLSITFDYGSGGWVTGPGERMCDGNYDDCGAQVRAAAPERQRRPRQLPESPVELSMSGAMLGTNFDSLYIDLSVTLRNAKRRSAGRCTRCPSRKSLMSYMCTLLIWPGRCRPAYLYACLTRFCALLKIVIFGRASETLR